MALCVPGMPCWQNTPYECDSCQNPYLVYPTECNRECIPISSDCVTYTGANLENSGVETGDDLTTVIQKLDQLVTESSVPLDRELTINGVTYDLSEDRSWSVGVVESISAGVGISIGGTSTIPIIINTAPDQIVTIASGTGILVTGSYPAFTIEATGGGGSSVFLADIPVVLSGGKTLGRYTNGQTIPSTGLTAEEVLNLIASEYVFPTWNSFSILGQATTIEVELAVTTPATFTWSISANSGVVSTIDIVDVTGSTTLVANTPNDGIQAGVALGVITLSTNGAQRVYKGVAHDTGTSPSDINSPNFTITARYLRFWAPVSTTPANSTQVRALPSAFQTAGNSFTLVTGTVEKKFSINLPPGVTIVSAIDITNLNANLTANFILIGTVSVNVANGAGSAKIYNQYEYNTAIPYSSSANIVITTS